MFTILCTADRVRLLTELSHFSHPHPRRGGPAEWATDFPFHVPMKPSLADLVHNQESIKAEHEALGR